MGDANQGRATPDSGLQGCTPGSLDYTVKWRVVDRLGKGAYIHEARFQSDSPRVVEIDAENQIAAWMETEYSEEELGNDELVMDYIVLNVQGREIANGEYSYFNSHEEF